MANLLRTPAAVAGSSRGPRRLSMNPAGRLRAVRGMFFTALLALMMAAGQSVAQSPPLRDGARRISVDFHDADIRSVLLAFSEYSGVSIIASQNLRFIRPRPPGVYGFYRWLRPTTAQMAAWQASRWPHPAAAVYPVFSAS